MAYEKLKTENYSNFKGINSKVSPYNNSPDEVVSLVNMDFQTPGSWSKRPGTTQMSIGGVSGRITGLYEHTQLSGASYVVFAANTNTYYLSANTPTVMQGGLQDSAITQFTTFVDRLFFYNGANFMKWKIGSTAFLFSLPQAIDIKGASAGLGGQTQVLWASATLSWSWGYINDRGFHGRPSNPVTVTTQGTSGGWITKQFIGLTSLNGGEGITFSDGATYFYMPIRASYGIGFTVTGFTTYTNGSGSTFATGTTTGFYGGVIYRDSGPSTTRFKVGYIPFQSFANGGTFLSSGSANSAFTDAAEYPQQNFPEPSVIHFTLFPRWMEIYNNQLFMTGFSPAPSVVWFSDPGEPENIESTYNFEVRTNDADVVTGLKAYLSQLFIFKQNTFHALSGDSIDNFSVRQVSDSYGCVSGRAVISYENKILFLDKKGIAEFNGANVQIVSNKVQPVFDRMNISAARDNAVMIHNKPRNQIWCAIPVDSSTTNNLIVVYDYLSDGWTTYENINASSLAMVQSNFNLPTAIYGKYSTGALFNFGASYASDNGTGFTCLVKTRYLHDQGDTTQKMFRRLWTNMDPITSPSSTLLIQMFADYQSTVSATGAISLSNFQQRIDFGVSAKSLQIQISHFSATDIVKIHGFSIAHRYLRDV